jgi:hypothetical protein
MGMSLFSRRSVRRLLGGILAAGLGLAGGAALTGLVQKHNQRATSRWQTASLAHDALIEITTLEAVRAELVSANEFDRNRLLQLWREHESRVDELLSNPGLRELDPAAVANTERWMSLYSSAANSQVSMMTVNPAAAEL